MSQENSLSFAATPAKLSLKGYLLRQLAGRLNNISDGKLSVTLPGGDYLEFGQRHPDNGAPIAHVRIHRWSVLWRLFLEGDLAFAQDWINGNWESPDIDSLFAIFMRNETAFALENTGNALRRWMDRRWHRKNANTRKGSRRNIAAHYDLGNDFYALWLDESMTYSSALFRTGHESLADAQAEKYHEIARLADIKHGHKVLEVGCGWGGFSEIAARDYGADISGLTLSTEQLAWANDRYADRNLAQTARASLTDYRDADGTYDRIVSIEMFEAVGEEHWDQYFAMLNDRLKAGGKAVLQVITIEDDRFDSYSQNVDFIQRYIFPGGLLPSPEKMQDLAQRHGFVMETPFWFGDSYAETCRRWLDRFQAVCPDLGNMGFDERFQRMWHYYLSYCIAGFDSGSINVGLFTLQKPE